MTKHITGALICLTLLIFICCLCSALTVSALAEIDTYLTDAETGNTEALDMGISLWESHYTYLSSTLPHSAFREVTSALYRAQAAVDETEYRQEVHAARRGLEELSDMEKLLWGNIF